MSKLGSNSLFLARKHIDNSTKLPASMVREAVVSVVSDMLQPGTAVTLDKSVPGAVTISSTGTNISLSNAGGTSIVYDGSGPDLVTKGLTAGAGVSLTAGVTDITINSSVSLSNAGGTSIVYDGTGPDLATKGLSAGSAISLTEGATDITIASTTSVVGTAYQTEIAQTGNVNYQVMLTPTVNIQTRETVGSLTTPSIAPGVINVVGPDSALSGPHINTYTNNDAYPVFQSFNFSHDNIALNFDCYYDGSVWKSSTNGAVYQIYKLGNKMYLRYNTSSTQGSTITFSNSLEINQYGTLYLKDGFPAVSEQTITVPFTTSGAIIHSYVAVLTKHNSTVTMRLTDLSAESSLNGTPTIITPSFIPADFRPVQTKPYTWVSGTYVTGGGLYYIGCWIGIYHDGSIIIAEYVSGFAAGIATTALPNGVGFQGGDNFLTWSTV